MGGRANEREGPSTTKTCAGRQVAVSSRVGQAPPDIGGLDDDLSYKTQPTPSKPSTSFPKSRDLRGEDGCASRRFASARASCRLPMRPTDIGRLTFHRAEPNRRFCSRRSEKTLVVNHATGEADIVSGLTSCQARYMVVRRPRHRRPASCSHRSRTTSGGSEFGRYSQIALAPERPDRHVSRRRVFFA